ncbi:helix-turn-helix domain-containing protein [Nonomuraea sp. NPDC049480]|uniref:helix-turn-helix domain-containing protein n=1 Tax=Nonomuraea sp. NPDC049480 TaxID=3364353 RepID=UPI003789E896
MSTGAPSPGFALYGPRLRKQLRMLRRQADLTQEEVARDMDWSTSKVIRIEGGDVRISVTDLRALLALYHITDKGQVEALVHMARQARSRPWWNSYRGIIDQPYMEYIAYEDSATSIQTFEPLVIPGLLQTREYAESVVQELNSPRVPANVANMTEIRMERQKILQKGPSAPRLTCVIDESVIRRDTTEPQAMARQLKAILELTQQIDLTVRVTPFTAGFHPGLSGPFIILGLPGDHEDVLFRETWKGMEQKDHFTGEDDPNPHVIEHKQIFAEILEIALPAEATRDLFEKRIAAIEA